MGWRHLLLICHYTPSTFRVYVVKWEEDDAKHDSLPELVVPDGDAVPEEKHLEYANAAVCQERRAAQTYQAAGKLLSLSWAVCSQSPISVLWYSSRSSSRKRQATGGATAVSDRGPMDQAHRQ